MGDGGGGVDAVGEEKMMKRCNGGEGVRYSGGGDKEKV